jgi:hypothetical protein
MKMKIRNHRTLACPTIVTLALTAALSLLLMPSSTRAQSPEGRWGVNAGVGVSPTVGEINGRLDTGWHIALGARYNLTSIFGLSLEYMYNGFGVNPSVLSALQVPDGHARMQSVTLNPILHLGSVGRFGAYAIGGGGFYRRTVEFTEPTTAIVTVFDPWWGYYGPAVVPTNRVLGSVSSNAPGVNAGLGFTIGLGHRGAQFYSEVRYHYAATKARNTQIIPVTFGVRW